MEIEVNVPETEIIGKDISVETGNTNIAISEDIKDLDITYNRKEYSIIGDSIFMPSMYEDAPPWLKEFIDTTISVSVTNRDQSLIDRMEAILTLMDYVPKNQYTEQINQIVSEDGIINSRIATLNSNLTGAINSTNATIAEINLTYASKNEAAAIASNIITASLSGSGEIGSTLIELQEAYANLDGTIAQSISMLESVMEGEINGNATAMETIRTYVGIDEAGAGTGTGLSAYLEDSNGVIGGADSQLANDVRVTAEGVESKFAYNSVVNINGIYKKSGFGITTNYTSGSGTEVDPYVSEFWIDASRFRFTNGDNNTLANNGEVFTIDASGVTPQVTFNGVVAFSNVTGSENLALTDMTNVTTIDGGKISTNTLYGNRLVGNTVSADKLTSSTGTSTTWTGGGLVSQNFNGNVAGSIGSPTQGFRLSSNASGTSTDPNIYGAYIKGAILEGTSLNISDVAVIAQGYPNNKGPIFNSWTYSNSVETSNYGDYSATTPSVTLVSRDYSSGFLSNRMCASSQKVIIKGESSGWTYFSNGSAGDTTVSVQVSTDGGSTWVSIGSASGAYSGKAVVSTTYGYTGSGTLQIRAVGTNHGAIYTTIDVSLVNSTY